MVTMEERQKAMLTIDRIEKAIENGDNFIFESNKAKKTWKDRLETLYYKLYHIYHPIRRQVSAWWQRRTIGFAYEEVWDLYSFHAAWIFPRLKYLKDHIGGTPFNSDAEPDEEGFGTAYTEEEWHEILSKMCRAFWLVKASDEDIRVEFDPLTPELIDEGLQLFAKHYMSLWD